MMSLKKSLPFVFMAMAFVSCSHVYTPALYHQDIAYQPKPTSFDTAKSQTYASAGLNGYSNLNLTDFLTSAQFNISRGHLFNNFNLAYGVFGVLGDYQNGSIDKGEANYFSDKFFGAAGGRVSGNFFVTEGRADIRFIGFEAAFSHEFGSYADFRQSIANQPDYFVDTNTDLFTLGLTSEVIFHNRGDYGFQHGIRGFLGTTLGRHDQIDNYYGGNQNNGDWISHHIFPKASYFITFNKYFGTLEVGNAIFVRFGLKF